jgi:adenylate cyclase
VTQSASPEEKWWRDNLLGHHPGLRLGHGVLKHVPSDPRCKLCAGPFAGVGGLLMRVAGKGPWPKNPKYCAACFRNMEKNAGGAEIGCSLLFADVRDSTGIAEQTSASEFRSIMSRFYETAARVLADNDAIVDKFIGDEVFAIFVPALAGARHSARAVAAARELSRTLISRDAGGTLPVGIGVHSGIAFVGTVGAEPHLELTAMGDNVNVAARLASAAAGSEILVSAQAADAARLETSGLERRDLSLKGKSGVTPVFVISA